MGKPAYKINVYGAQVSGIAAAYAHLHRLDQAQALAEIREILARLSEADRRTALIYAASGYLRARTADWWFPDAAALLREAGADMDAAQTRAAEPRQDIMGLGEQAARLS
jgi:hypothetical protein